MEERLGVLLSKIVNAYVASMIKSVVSWSEYTHWVIVTCFSGTILLSRRSFTMAASILW
jgi:hypothetical protein